MGRLASCMAAASRGSAHQVADLVDDSLGSGQKHLRLDRAEIGKVGCVATIDDPRVEDVEILWIDVRRAGWWVARVQLAQPVDLGN